MSIVDFLKQNKRIGEWKEGEEERGRKGERANKLFKVVAQRRTLPASSYVTQVLIKFKWKLTKEKRKGNKWNWKVLN